MMNNSSSDFFSFANLNQTINQEQVIINAVYVVLGVLGTVAHALMILTIIANHKLHRKELFILLGACFAELIYSIGYMLGGSKRLYWFLHTMEKNPISVWECQTQSFIFFYIVGPQLTAIMNLYISVDRFIAVAFYQQYLRLRVKHIIFVMLSLCTVILGSYAAGFFIAYSTPLNVTVPQQCLSTWASSTSYAVYYTSFIATMETLSVVVYTAVILSLNQYASHLIVEVKSSAKERQMKVTKTVTLTVTLSFFFYIVPWVTQALLNALKVNLGSASLLSPIMWISIQGNNVLMSAIYWTKLDDVRKIFIKMVMCRRNQVVPGLVTVSRARRSQHSELFSQVRTTNRATSLAITNM